MPISSQARLPHRRRIFHFTLDSHLAHGVWDTYDTLSRGIANWGWLFAQKAPKNL